MRLRIVLAVTAMSLSGPSFARTMFAEGIFQKQAEKESTRWTLADWMTQKKQFRAMDQWLALNRTLSLFEINIEGSSAEYDLIEAGVEASVKKKITRGSVTLFWSIFGLQYSMEDSDEDWTRESAQFNLRLLGTSSQTTNLTAYYGVRRWTMDGPPKVRIDNNYAGAKLNIYVVSFFGLEGEYTKHFRDHADNNDEYESERIEYGGFFDIYFVRLYGSAFKETVNRTSSGTPQEDTREGALAGVKFYF